MQLNELPVVDTDDGPAAVLPDGRALRLLSMTYGKVRLTVSSSPEVGWYDDGW